MSGEVESVNSFAVSAEPRSSLSSGDCSFACTLRSTYQSTSTYDKCTNAFTLAQGCHTTELRSSLYFPFSFLLFCSVLFCSVLFCSGLVWSFLFLFFSFLFFSFLSFFFFFLSLPCMLVVWALGGSLGVSQLRSQVLTDSLRDCVPLAPKTCGTLLHKEAPPSISPVAWAPCYPHFWDRRLCSSACPQQQEYAMAVGQDLCQSSLDVGRSSQLFFSQPLASAIPHCAIAPVLVIVGIAMTAEAREIAWWNMLDAVPAFLCAIFQPFTYSVANGIYVGVSFSLILLFSTGSFVSLIHFRRKERRRRSRMRSRRASTNSYLFLPHAACLETIRQDRCG